MAIHVPLTARLIHLHVSQPLAQVGHHHGGCPSTKAYRIGVLQRLRIAPSHVALIVAHLRAEATGRAPARPDVGLQALTAKLVVATSRHEVDGRLNMAKVDARTLVFLISSLGDVVRGAVRWRERERELVALSRVWEWGRLRGMLSEPHYDVYMNLHGALQNWQEVMRLLDEMCETGVRADVRTYTTVLSALGRARRWEEVAETVVMMREAGVEPDGHFYIRLLGVWESAEQWERVLAVHEEMKSAGFAPDVFAYFHIVTACRHLGQWERAMSLLDAMRAEGMRADDFIYAAVVGALGKGKQFARALVRHPAPWPQP